MQYVYVINMHGEPLMPCSPRKARLLLKEGEARVVKRTPFTIRLLHGCAGYKQPITLGVDAGSKHIGLSACTEKQELYKEEIGGYAIMEYENVKNAISERDAIVKEICKKEAELRKELGVLKKDTFVVIDENQSVAWNRAERERQIRSTQGKLNAIAKQYAKANEKVSNAIEEVLQDEYCLPKAIVGIVMQMANEDGHAAGWYEVFCYAVKYAEFAERVLDVAQ